MTPVQVEADARCAQLREELYERYWEWSLAAIAAADREAREAGRDTFAARRDAHAVVFLAYAELDAQILAERRAVVRAEDARQCKP